MGVIPPHRRPYRPPSPRSICVRASQAGIRRPTVKENVPGGATKGSGRAWKNGGKQRRRQPAQFRLVVGGYGEPTTIMPPHGQRSFRIAVLDACARRCAVTQERPLAAQRRELRTRCCASPGVWLTRLVIPSVSEGSGSVGGAPNMLKPLMLGAARPPRSLADARDDKCQID